MRRACSRWLRASLGSVIGTVLLLSSSGSAYATTWDEPWHEDVVRKASTFGKVQVVDADEHGSVVKTLETLAGEKLPERFPVGTRAHAHGDFLDRGETYFVFVEKSGDAWKVASPIASVAHVKEGMVVATYRHSYHQALVPEALYVKTQKILFQHLHGERVDRKALKRLFEEHLGAKPAAPAGDPENAESRRFFGQHVALELFYHLGTPDEYGYLEPFLQSTSYHVQISAVRALSRIDTPRARKRLFEFLTGPSQNDFAKVMAVWGLRRLDAREFEKELAAFVEKATTRKTGFGGSIMDPRVATRFPGSVREATAELLAEWRERPRKEE